MDTYEVVKKLLGEINPVGESNTDAKRFENLKTTTELVDKLLFDIGHVAGCKTDQRYSMGKAGKFASLFLDMVKVADN